MDCGDRGRDRIGQRYRGSWREGERERKRDGERVRERE